MRIQSINVYFQEIAVCQQMQCSKGHNLQYSSTDGVKCLRNETQNIKSDNYFAETYSSVIYPKTSFLNNFTTSIFTYFCNSIIHAFPAFVWLSKLILNAWNKFSARDGNSSIIWAQAKDCFAVFTPQMTKEGYRRHKRKLPIIPCTCWSYIILTFILNIWKTFFWCHCCIFSISVKDRV